MDAGVIRCLKAHYRTNLARARLIAFEDKCEFSMDVKYGMELLKNLGQLCPKAQSETASEKLASLHLVMKLLRSKILLSLSNPDSCDAHYEDVQHGILDANV